MYRVCQRKGRQSVIRKLPQRSCRHAAHLDWGARLEPTSRAVPAEPWPVMLAIDRPLPSELLALEIHTYTSVCLNARTVGDSFDQREGAARRHSDPPLVICDACSKVVLAVGS